MASFIACIWSRTLQLPDGSLLLLDTKHRRDALDSRDTVLFPPVRQFFSSLIDGYLKYKHKEKPKSLNYDVKIGPIEARSGSGWNAGLYSVPLGRNHVSPSGGPLPSWALRIVLTFPPPLRRPWIHDTVTPLIISLLSPLHSSPAGGAKTHTRVCQTPLNLRGRRSVLPRSLLFCCEASLIFSDFVVCVNRKIQFLKQVSK